MCVCVCFILVALYMIEVEFFEQREKLKVSHKEEVASI